MKINKFELIKTTFLLAASQITLLATLSSAYAEAIVINSRYIVPQEQVLAYFYGNRNEGLTFLVNAGGIQGWELKYTCISEWDWTKIKRASLAFARNLNKSKSIEIHQFLLDQGFAGCSLK